MISKIIKKVGKLVFKIIFCDDNSQFLASLRSLVKKECSKIVASEQDYMIGPAFGSGHETMKYIRENHVDVLFLDIDMPGMNGFEVAKQLSEEYPRVKIVFMSAYDNLVYSTFDYYPFAYIRKSHMGKELPKLMTRIVDKIYEATTQLIIDTLVGEKSVNVNSIVYVESNKNYCNVYLIYGKKYICRGTLTSFEKMVEKYDFYRIHSAYLVNFEHIERILPNGFLLVDNATLPIAQRRLQEFKKEYMEYIRRSFNT